MGIRLMTGENIIGEKYYLRFKDDKKAFMHFWADDAKSSKVNFELRPTHEGAGIFGYNEAIAFINKMRLYRLEPVNVKDVTENPNLFHLKV